MYVNAGAMQEARKLFDEMPERSLVSWTIVMSGYARHGPASEVLMMFWDMLCGSGGGLLRPDSFVFAVVLRACGMVECLSYGRGVHGLVVKQSSVVDSFVENALVSMYASCGALEDAAVVFGGIDKPDLVGWSSILSGYVKNGLEEEGLRIFCDMVSGGIEPDAFAFSMVLGACTNLECWDFGTQAHCYIIKMGFDSCLYLENSLMDFYAKCGDLEGMRRVFSHMSEKNLVSWNTFINGYVHNFHYLEALRIFQILMEEVSQCDDFSLLSILKAVSGLGHLDHGKEIHGFILRAGIETNRYVVSSLLDMYIGCIDHESLYPRVEVPLKLLNYLEGGGYDEFVMTSLLKWCSLESSLESGKMFHSLIIKLDLKSDSYVLSSLIDMYSKCGIWEAAKRVFTRVEQPDTAPWSALISGHSWNGCFAEALKLFRKMQFDGIKANEFTFTSVILACLALENLRKGKELHCKILRSGYESNFSVVNTLINLYSELWQHKQALKLCSMIPDSEISWNFLIRACLGAEDYEIIHKLLWRIQVSHGNLDPVSACDIFASCSSPVLLNVGTQAHAYMTKRGLISHPTISNSLIQMYSACGKIDEAVQAFNLMPEKDTCSWTSILSARVEHGHPSEALNLISQMRWKNKPADQSTFRSVLNACAQMGLVDEAFRLFFSMKEVYGIEPLEEHYSCMVEVLGRAGMFEEVLDFINGVPTFKLGPLIWRTLLSSSRIHGNMKVAKYAAEKLLELEPSDFSANLLLEQVLLTLGEWDNALKLKTKTKSMRASSSWIEIRNRIYEFASDENPAKEVSTKLAEIEGKMEELGYVADKNHLLHNAEEEEYDGVGLHHTEMKALAFGLISLPHGMPVRVVKNVRMCGDCHSACKFMSTFLERELVVKDPYSFHHFRDGKCSCRDTW